MGRKNIIKSNRKVIAEGLRDGVPIGLGYLAVSFSLGIAAKNAGLNFFAIYRTLTLADRSALINNANFYVFVKLDKFVCHEYAGCTCTDNNYVIILSHNYFLSNQNPVYFYP